MPRRMTECSEGTSGTTTVTEEITESPTVCKIFYWNFQLTGNPELNTAEYRSLASGKVLEKSWHDSQLFSLFIGYNDSSLNDGGQ